MLVNLISVLSFLFLVGGFPSSKSVSPPNVDILDPPVLLTIVNVANNGSIFTFEEPIGPDQEVLLPMISELGHQHGHWWRYKVSGRTDEWIFKNRGTGQWLQIAEDPYHYHKDQLIAVDGYSPTHFAVEPAGKGELVIKLPYEDKVWEAIYDGTSMLYGRVALRPANGSPYQRWKYAAPTGSD
ncbi:hypothetical protein C8R43DRAFT_952214 [Mycena crocata]|nr:hypothetical protein C8R43DRAFT_952214 [Mycena crocata]